MRQIVRSVYRRLPFKRPLYQLLRDRFGLTPAFFQHLHFRGPFELEIDDRHSIRLFSNGRIVENELFWLGFGKGWEATSLRLWHRLCSGADGTILDIGANTGVYSLVAARLAPSARVIAFEPIARVCAELRRNVALNALDVEVEQRAVSDHDGMTAIFDVPGEFNYSASIEGQGPDAERVEVPVCSIDRFLPQTAAPVTAVKIDVERHEPAVISGMKRRLANDRPPMLIEILDERIGSEVANQLEGLGYLMFHIAERSGIIPAKRLAPLGDHDWNHLLCTKEQFDKLRLGDFVQDCSSLDGPTGIPDFRRDPAISRQTD